MNLFDPNEFAKGHQVKKMQATGLVARFQQQATASQEVLDRNPTQREQLRAKAAESAEAGEDPTVIPFEPRAS